MKPNHKIILEACLATLRSTLGTMPADEADRLVSAVIAILQGMHDGKF